MKALSFPLCGTALALIIGGHIFAGQAKARDRAISRRLSLLTRSHWPAHRRFGNAGFPAFYFEP